MTAAIGNHSHGSTPSVVFSRRVIITGRLQFIREAWDYAYFSLNTVYIAQIGIGAYKTIHKPLILEATSINRKKKKYHVRHSKADKKERKTRGRIRWENVRQKDIFANAKRKRTGSISHRKWLSPYQLFLIPLEGVWNALIATKREWNGDILLYWSMPGLFFALKLMSRRENESRISPTSRCTVVAKCFFCWS